MFTRITNSKLFARLKDRKYRNLFIGGEVRRTIPFQLRALRAARKWTQAELGKEADMPQTVISRIENGDAASLSIKTLLKLASAFDVALVVRFEPIDKLIHWVDDLSSEVMSPRKSAEILTEMEKADALPLEHAALAARTLQALPSALATGIQTTLTFDRPEGVPTGQRSFAGATWAALSTGNLSTDQRVA